MTSPALQNTTLNPRALLTIASLLKPLTSTLDTHNPSVFTAETRSVCRSHSFAAHHCVTHCHDHDASRTRSSGAHRITTYLQERVDSLLETCSRLEVKRIQFANVADLGRHVFE